MTYSTALSTGDSHRVDLTLLIDGIPILFGTRAGLVHPRDNITAPPASLTSVAAIRPGSIRMAGARLDNDKLLVPPTSVELALELYTPTATSSQNWDHYFERRRTPVCITTDNPLTGTATTVNVNSTSGFSLGGTQLIYCERETMLVGSGTSTSFSVTRNYCSLPTSRAASHINGSTISTVPRYLFGRGAEVRLWLNGTESKIHGYVYLTSSPRRDDDTGSWVMSFDSAMRVFDRKLYVGWKGSTINDSSITGGEFEFTPADDREFFSVANNGQVLIATKTSKDDKGKHAICRIDSSGSSVRVAYEDWNTSDAHFFNYQNAVGGTIRRVFDLTQSGSPLHGCLYAMLSDRGDGANHATYDTLPGLSSSGTSATNRLEPGDVELRMGAAIPSGLIDVAGIEDAAELVEGWSYVLGGSGGEESLLKLMEEAAWAMNGYWRFNNSGQLTFRKFDAAYVNDDYTQSLNTSHILRDSPLVSIDDESQIVHTFNIKCNFGRGGFQSEITAYYIAERDTYREIRGTKTIERRGLYVTGDGIAPPDETMLFVFARPTSVDAVRMRLDRMFARYASGARKYEVKLPWDFHTITPGDRVKITSPYLRDFEGGTLNVDTFEVLEVTLTYGDSVTIVVQDLWAGKLISPTGIVTAWDAGTNAATLSTNNKFCNSTNQPNPAQYFQGGWRVRGMRSSGSPRTWSQAWTATVSGGNADVLTMTGAPTSAPAAGDLIIQNTYQAGDTQAANDEQGAAQHDYAFMADTTYQLGSGTISQPHGWG